MNGNITNCEQHFSYAGREPRIVMTADQVRDWHALQELRERRKRVWMMSPIGPYHSLYESGKLAALENLDRAIEGLEYELGIIR